MDQVEATNVLVLTFISGLLGDTVKIEVIVLFISCLFKIFLLH